LVSWFLGFLKQNALSVVLFIPEEVEEIMEFTHRVEPIGSQDASGQQKLFD
jgi:hypothetical protein